MRLLRLLKIRDISIRHHYLLVLHRHSSISETTRMFLLRRLLEVAREVEVMVVIGVEEVVRETPQEVEGKDIDRAIPSTMNNSITVYR